MKALLIGLGSAGRKHLVALMALGWELELLSSWASPEALARILTPTAPAATPEPLDTPTTTAPTTLPRILRSWEECELDDFDFFIIANETARHFESVNFINERVKNKIILVEKPLFAEPLSALLASPFLSQNEIFTGYLLRFHPAVIALRNFLARLGEEVFFASLECASFLPAWREGNYEKSYSARDQDGGVLRDLSHELDLAFFLFGDLDLVFAQNEKRSELKIKSDDLAFLILKNEKLSVHIRLSYFSHFEKRQIVIHSKNYSARADLLAHSFEFFTRSSPAGSGGKKENYEKQNLFLKLHEAILKKDATLCKFSQALRVVDLIDEVRRRFKK